MKILKYLKLTQTSRLRNKILAFTITLAVVPILILGSLTLYLLGTSYRTNISNLELQAIDHKIEEIEKFFADTLGILEIRVGFAQTSEIELSEQQFLLAGILEENTAFEEVSFISLVGQETAKKNRQATKVDLLDVSRLPQFIQTSQGNNFISSSYQTLAGPMITIAAPVRNRNGIIIQILTAEVNLSQITQFIKNTSLGSSGYLILLDEQGFLMAHGSDGDIKLGSNLKSFSRVNQILNGAILSGLSDKDRYQSFFSQTPVIGAGKKLSKTNWVILSEWPIVEAEAIIRDVRNQIMRFALFSILAVLLLAPLFVERLIRPIRQLKQAALDIQAGRFDKKIKIQTNDEIEELGNAFNNMAKGLKRLEELRNEFVFIAAHQLRSPITVIKGYVSMVLEGDFGKIPKQVQESLAPVMQSAQGLNRLVDDLLEVARSEAGKIEIDTTPTNIAEQVKKNIAEFKVLASQKSIKLIYRPMAKIPQVLADSEKLSEIIKNLIDNAIKYTIASGQITIWHQIKGKMLYTYVKDTGIGMSPENQKKLFSKFYRVKTDQTAKIKGTGLGLWIIKQLLQRMNGKIWVTSQQGKGSCFIFSLPLTTKV